MLPSLIFAAVVSYLLGAVPFGFLICRLWSGVDIRQVGSGRTGGTNVLRAAGWGPAILTILADTGKAYLAVLLAQKLGGSPAVAVVAGVAVVLGHNHSVFLGFRGGAGSMTNVGALLAFSPLIAGASVLASAIPLAISRFASLGSVCLAIFTPIALWAGFRWGNLPREYIIYGIGSGLMTLYELRPNIMRLLQGSERKIGERARLDPATIK